MVLRSSPPKVTFNIMKAKNLLKEKPTDNIDNNEEQASTSESTKVMGNSSVISHDINKGEESREDHISKSDEEKKKNDTKNGKRRPKHRNTQDMIWRLGKLLVLSLSRSGSVLVSTSKY